MRICVTIYFKYSHDSNFVWTSLSCRCKQGETSIHDILLMLSSDSQIIMTAVDVEQTCRNWSDALVRVNVYVVPWDLIIDAIQLGSYIRYFTHTKLQWLFKWTNKLTEDITFSVCCLWCFNISLCHWNIYSVHVFARFSFLVTIVAAILKYANLSLRTQWHH